MSELSLDPSRPDFGTAAADALKPVHLLSSEREGRAFWRMRAHLVRNVVRQTLEAARLRLVLVLVLSGMLWLALFWLFVDGFRFIRTAIVAPDLHDRTVQAVFGMFFVALMVMLVFSSGVILYSSLFRGRDVPFLLSLPARAERVFLQKFQEAILMSSWAFLLLGSPMLLAYGLTAAAPWYYYAMLLPFLLAFIYIPSGLGAVLCMAIVYWLPRGRLGLAVFLALAAVGGLAWMAWSLATGPESDLLTPDWFQEMLGRMRMTEHRLLPSWWLSAGLLEAASHTASESVLFLALLISNALFFRLVAVTTAGRIYRKGYHALHGRPGPRKRIRSAWFDHAVDRAAGVLAKQSRLLIIKDLRLFRRDPVQWSQFLIFFGLLTLYFLNVRRFSYDMYHVGWVNLVSFLNLSVVGLLLSTFTTRFIFPMISLEGQRFWILGLLPIRRETILWSKLLFAVAGSIVPCCGLILLSDAMLRVSPLILVSHQLTCVVLCFGLSGIAVGMGARMPSFREQSPAKIAAGFGGTLNLVLSTLYIVAVVLLTALPAHFYLDGRSLSAAELLSSRHNVAAWVQTWFFAGMVGSLVLGAIATWVPMRIGVRAFREIEV